MLYLFLPVYPQCDPHEQHELAEAATNDAKPQTLAIGTRLVVMLLISLQLYVKLDGKVPKNFLLPFHSDGGQMQATRPWECRPNRMRRD